LVILERSLTVAAQCFGAAIHDALHMIYTRCVIGSQNADLATDFAPEITLQIATRQE
jgi:hypothetical protein